MNLTWLVHRATQMLVSPQTEWEVVAREAMPPRQVMTGYFLPLATLGSGIMFVAAVLVGLAVTTSFLVAFSGLVTVVVACIVGALIAENFGTILGGTGSREQAFKLVAYAYTPSLVAALIPIPILGRWLRLAALIYSIYLLHQGFPPLMKTPKDRAIPSTLLVVIAMFVASVVVTMLLGMLLITGSFFTGNPFRIV